MRSFGKRIDGPGGRRRAARQPVAMEAAAMTLKSSHSVIVRDLSPTGAQIVGRDLPPIGTAVVLKCTSLDVFATVIWNEKGCCGIQFDALIPPERLTGLVGSTATLGQFNAQERIALDHWANGSLP